MSQAGAEFSPEEKSTWQSSVLWVAERMNLVTPCSGNVRKENNEEFGSSDPVFASGQMV